MAGRARLFAGAKWEREGRWAGREGGGAEVLWGRRGKR